MKRAVTVGLIFMLAAGCSRQPSGDYPIKPVAFSDVKVEDDFWLPRLETNHRITIPHALQQCEETGRFTNFAVAAGLEEGEHQGYFFNDSDVMKIIEGAAYSLAIFPDPGLEEYVDGVIETIAAAQEEDGYLYTARTAMTPDNMPPGGWERWSNIEDGHELYCSGHMYEGAIAYYEATGKRVLLDAAIRNADLINEVFGPDGLRYPPGHEEIEIALGKLYRLTGDEKYLALAAFFIDERGDPDGHDLYGEYAQDHEPVVEQDHAVGHAVRAAYLYSGMADIASLTGNDKYIKALDRIWAEAVGTKLYITGGIGATGGNEGFSHPYALPNSSAYSETCASIANAMWNHRMFLLHGDAKYMDVVERVIYNAFLSGISLEGDLFFYPNRLQTFDGENRSPWFNCACCPSNVVRFLPSIPGYAYAHSGDDIYVNLFIAGRGTVRTEDGEVTIIQRTLYPWDSTVTFRVEPAGGSRRFTLNIRLPGWARNEAVPGDLYGFLDHVEEEPELLLNGRKTIHSIRKGYVRIRRRWRAGDEITLRLPMPVRRIVAHDNVIEDRGRVALQRGPVVYCLEWLDTAGGYVRNLVLPDEAVFSTQFIPDLLDGVQVIWGDALALRYTGEGDEPEITESPDRFLAIPYYGWSHRGRGEMSVWLAREPSAARPLPRQTIEYRSEPRVSFGPDAEATVDQMEPASSIDHTVPYWHWWPHRGTTEWVQFDFGDTETVSRVEVYWFDDEGIGQCRPPASWRILYSDRGLWKEVRADGSYGVEKDRYNVVTFDPVRTDGLRLEIKSQQEWAGGIHEIRIR